jgi:predicted amidophosphoribosyltransferase
LKSWIRRADWLADQKVWHRAEELQADVVPVPLANGRQWERGFNHVELLSWSAWPNESACDKLQTTQAG